MLSQTPSSASEELPGVDLSTSEISLVDIFVALGERKVLIFKIVAVVALVTAIVSFILPSRYTASVALLPPQQNGSLSSTLASQLGNLGGMAALAGNSIGVKNPNEMFVGLLKSRSVEDAMVQKYRLQDEYKTRYLSDARLALERHVHIDGSGKDGLIRISVDDRDPSRAAELANGYVAQFRSVSERLAITEAAQRRLFFEEQLGKVKNSLADAEEQLKRTEQRTGIVELTGQTRALIESAAMLRAQIAAKEVQLRSLRTFATEQNAQIVQAQNELDSLKSQLAKLGSAGNGTGEDLIQSGRVTEASVEYVRKLRDVKYYEAMFDILARQFEAAKLDEAKEGAAFQILDAAVPPDKRSFPKRGVILVSGVLGGLLLGILAALGSAIFARVREDQVGTAKLGQLRRAWSFSASSLHSGRNEEIESRR
jgi:tyrosine-protein kinase Etk/Wzc